MLFYLVYVSSGVKLFSAPELVELLTKSRARNSEAGITGMLLYKDGNFMQVLEGEKEAVLSLHTKIHNDSRHRGLITLLQGELAEREFPDWSMAFRDMSKANVLSGYSEFLNSSRTDVGFKSDPMRCRRLLMTFKKNMR